MQNSGIKAEPIKVSTRDGHVTSCGGGLERMASVKGSNSRCWNWRPWVRCQLLERRWFPQEEILVQYFCSVQMGSQSTLCPQVTVSGYSYPKKFKWFDKLTGHSVPMDLDKVSLYFSVRQREQQSLWVVPHAGWQKTSFAQKWRCTWGIKKKQHREYIKLSLLLVCEMQRALLPPAGETARLKADAQTEQMCCSGRWDFRDLRFGENKTFFTLRGWNPVCQRCCISKMDQGNVCNVKGVAYGNKPTDNVHRTKHTVGWWRFGGWVYYMILKAVPANWEHSGSHHQWRQQPSHHRRPRSRFKGAFISAPHVPNKTGVQPQKLETKLTELRKRKFTSKV